ncbi:MAG: hypothetical protein WBP61_14915 [Nocardioides sp.]
MDDTTTPDITIDSAHDRVREQRIAVRLRHTQALTSLMEERTDLKGVHALADYFDDAVRWSA